MEQICTICLEPSGDGSDQEYTPVSHDGTSCSHTFHYNCIISSIQSCPTREDRYNAALRDYPRIYPRCPNCRTDIMEICPITPGKIYDVNVQWTPPLGGPQRERPHDNVRLPFCCLSEGYVSDDPTVRATRIAQHLQERLNLERQHDQANLQIPAVEPIVQLINANNAIPQLPNAEDNPVPQLAQNQDIPVAQHRVFQALNDAEPARRIVAVHRFDCLLCGVTFARSMSLRIHTRIHHPTFPMNRQMNRFQLHLPAPHRQHVARRGVRQNIANQEQPAAIAIDNIANHDEPGDNAAVPPALNNVDIGGQNAGNHLQNRNPQEPALIRPYVCTICRRQYDTRYALSSHLRHHHHHL